MRQTPNWSSWRSGLRTQTPRVLPCARKIQAEKIYTWNVKHFQMVAPDLADRIVTP